MPRTTAAAVLAIMTEHVPEDANVDAFISDTSDLVTELCVPSGYSDSRLEIIERWLSAHFICINYMQYVQDNIDSLQTTYQQRVALAFDQTRYGQQAKLFDTAGNLAGLQNQQEKQRRLPAGLTSLTYLGTRRDANGNVV